MEDRDRLISLHMAEGIGNRTLYKLLSSSVKLSSLNGKSSEWLSKKLHISLSTAKNLLEAAAVDAVDRSRKILESKRIMTITILDSTSYPPWLAFIPDPPFVLYAMGDISVLKKPMLSIVGTRNPTSYGKAIARHLARKLADRGWAVISGLAAGIDGEAHRGALDSGVSGSTAAVLGGGVDIVYPSENRSLFRQIAANGLLLSEYPPGTMPKKGTFPLRNRIISGLSRGVIVVEAAKNSGSLITVDHALGQGRDVFAVPGPILSSKSEGTNNLIQQGAKLIINIKDILEEYRDVPIQPEANVNLQLTEDEQILLKIMEYSGLHVDELIRRSGLPVSKVYTLLLSLELKRLVQQLPGSRFIKIHE